MLERMLEEIKDALKETYLHIANDYDVSDLHHDGDKVACTAGAFRNLAEGKIEDIIRSHMKDESEFSQENIKVGHIVEIEKLGICRVVGVAKENIAYEILNGIGAGICGKAAYTQIKRIVTEKIKIEQHHPFKAGEKYTVKVRWRGQYIDKEYTITKVTVEKVTLKSGTDKEITRKPRKYRDKFSPSGYSWVIGVVNGIQYGTIYKYAEK